MRSKESVSKGGEKFNIRDERPRDNSTKGSGTELKTVTGSPDDLSHSIAGATVGKSA